MLPLSTKQLKIYWHPARIVVLLQQGLLKPRVIEKRLLDESHSEVDSGSMLERLDQFLSQKNIRNIGARLIVSGDMVKYQVSVWDAHLEYAEQHALAQHQFNEIYAISSPEWQVYLGDAGFGRNQLACAVRTDVLPQLTDMANRHQLTMTSVTPSLIGVINYFRKKIVHDAWLISIEHDCMYVVKFLNGVPVTMRTSKLYEGWPGELDVLLTRESLFLAENTLPVYIFWPENISSTHALLKHSNITLLSMNLLPGLLYQQDKSLMVALCA